MHVVVTNVYSDEAKTFDGSPEQVKGQLLQTYSFLDLGEQQDDIHAVLDHLEGTQAYSVDVHDASDAVSLPGEVLGKGEGLRRPFAFDHEDTARAFERDANAWAREFETKYGLKPTIKRHGKVVLITVPGITTAGDDQHLHGKAKDHGGKHIGGALRKDEKDYAYDFATEDEAKEFEERAKSWSGATVRRSGTKVHVTRGGESLTKKLGEADTRHLQPQNRQAQVDHKPDLTAHPPDLAPSIDHFNEHIVNSPDEPLPVHGVGGVMDKTVYDTPAPHYQRYMVKQYHDSEVPLHGWAEMTSQSLYHAAGIGHLHQAVHVAEFPRPVPKLDENGDEMWEPDPTPDPGWGKLGGSRPVYENQMRPGLVVHMDNSMVTLNKLGYAEPAQIKAQGQALVPDMTRIHVMDYVMGNNDRHRGNLMMNRDIKAQPRVLAIDHGHAFKHHHQDLDQLWFAHERSAAAQHVGMYGHEISGEHIPMPDDEYMTPHGLKWWAQVGQQVRQKFNERVQQIGNPEVRASVANYFTTRANHLDKMAAGHQNVGQETTNANG